MKTLLALLLTPTLALAQIITEDCSTYTPTHSSGLNFTERKIPLGEIQSIWGDIKSPSVSLTWGGIRNVYITTFIKEFLRTTRGKDRRLQIYLVNGGFGVTGDIDPLVNFLMNTNEFSFDLEELDPSEISLCLVKDDNLSDGDFAKWVVAARNMWPWSICRSPKPTGKIRSRAGADTLNVTDTSIPASLLGKDYSLEYSWANVEKSFGTKALLRRMRNHWNAGAVDLEAWFGPGGIEKYKMIVKELDRLAYAHIPGKCLDENGQVIGGF